MVSVFKTITGSNDLMMKYFTENNFLMNSKRKAKFLNYLEQLSIFPLQLDVSVERNEYNLSDYLSGCYMPYIKQKFNQMIGEEEKLFDKSKSFKISRKPSKELFSFSF